MQFCRFMTDQGAQWGAIEHRDGVPWITRIITSPEEDRVQPHTGNFVPVAAEEAGLLAPVVPSKIVCVGRNYSAHARELGNDLPAEPLLFFKPPSSVIGPGQAILLPPVSRQVDFEGELAVVIGKTARDLGEDDDVSSFIRGYTCVNDVTARDLQKTDGQWARAKGFDSFCPVGPWLVDEKSLNVTPAPGRQESEAGVAITTRLNGEIRQQGDTRDLIFSVPTLIRYISRIFTLLPGDLICTGTPAGVGPMTAGDTVEVAIAGIGALRNTVAVRA